MLLAASAVTAALSLWSVRGRKIALDRAAFLDALPAAGVPGVTVAVQGKVEEGTLERNVSQRASRQFVTPPSTTWTVSRTFRVDGVAVNVAALRDMDFAALKDRVEEIQDLINMRTGERITKSVLQPSTDLSCVGVMNASGELEPLDDWPLFLPASPTAQAAAYRREAQKHKLDAVVLIGVCGITGVLHMLMPRD